MADDDEPREISGVTTKLILEYVADTVGRDGAARMLDLAGLVGRADELSDERSWWSQETKTALFQAAADVTGDPAVARRIGEHVITPRLSGTLKYPMTAEGSAAGVFRNIAAAVAKFTMVADLQPAGVGDDWATLHFRLDDPARATRFDCDYLQGLASTVPRLFGRRYGRVDQEQCQIEGADHCVISVRWSDVDVVGDDASFEVEAARAQLHALQSTVADLVSVDDIDDLLTRIAGRASVAMRAQRYLLAVRVVDGGPLQVRADGISADTAERLAEALLDPTVTDDQHALVVDITSSRHGYGRLAAYFPPGRSFFTAEHELLRAYGRVAAAALDSVTALATARAERATAEALLWMSERLADCAEVDDVADVTSESLMAMISVPTSCVLLWDDLDDSVSVVAPRGVWPAGLRTAVEAVAADRTSRRRWVELGPRVEVRAGEDDVGDGPGLLCERLGVRRAAIVPVARGAALQGCALGMWRTDGDVAPPRDAMVRLRGLSDQALVAMARAEALREVRRQASHDDLTTLPRRPLLLDRLGQAMARHRRTSGNVALLFVDLDNFKQVNDSWGHAAGDGVLRVVADRMTAALRDTDTVSRIGGDEFAVLLPDVEDLTCVQVVADTLVAVINEPIALHGTATVSVGASIGIACAGPDTADAGRLLERADEAMYAAKRAGGGWKAHAAVR